MCHYISVRCPKFGTPFRIHPSAGFYVVIQTSHPTCTHVIKCVHVVCAAKGTSTVIPHHRCLRTWRHAFALIHFALNTGLGKHTPNTAPTKGFPHTSPIRLRTSHLIEKVQANGLPQTHGHSHDGNPTQETRDHPLHSILTNPKTQRTWVLY